MINYAAAAVLAVALHLLVSLSIRRFKWRMENFKGDTIPHVFGLYIVTWGAVGAGISHFLPFGSHPAATLYLIAILGFGLLGLLDDLLGSRNVGGFGGHFKKLLLEGKLTTGVVKALGGGLLAVYLAYRTSDGLIWRWVLDAALIALAANTINLLDLRPGRALFLFFLGLAPVAAIKCGIFAAPIAILAASAAAGGVSYYDVRGRAMLGDVGSNTLGAVLGLTFALEAGLAGKIAVVAIFMLINVYSERRSISKLIERNPVLGYIDSKLGVR
ncbi:MAG TPA: hypothetical protein PLU88_01405 [Armatimonadota bacterium]|nr:hypothetical protein [Armatimonadota bacterium]